MNIFSINFWVQTFISAFVTMCCIYIIKRVTQAVDIPVVSNIAQEV